MIEAIASLSPLNLLEMRQTMQYKGNFTPKGTKSLLTFLQKKPKARSRATVIIDSGKPAKRKQTCQYAIMYKTLVKISKLK